MSAKPQPADGQPSKAELFIAEHQKKYSEAITAARDAGDTTNTVAWISNYMEQMKAHKTTVKESLTAIEMTCSAIDAYDTSDEAEKSIKDSVKILNEERIRFNAWSNRAASPYRLTVVRCDELLAACLRDARNEECKAPLVNSGLASEVAALVKTWPTPTWNEERGTVAVN